MITVAPETACMLYLACTLIAVLFIWFRKRYRSHDNTSTSSERIICEFCSLSYVDDTHKSFTRCPHCHFLNKHIQR